MRRAQGPSRLAVALALPLAPALPGHALTGPSTARGLSGSVRFIGLDALEGAPLDRKSTRLNSSHQIISYAVFCLKKKKNENLLPPPPKRLCHLAANTTNLSRTDPLD